MENGFDRLNLTLSYSFAITAKSNLRCQSESACLARRQACRGLFDRFSAISTFYFSGERFLYASPAITAPIMGATQKSHSWPMAHPPSAKMA